MVERQTNRARAIGGAAFLGADRELDSSITSKRIVSHLFHFNLSHNDNEMLQTPNCSNQRDEDMKLSLTREPKIREPEIREPKTRDTGGQDTRAQDTRYETREPEIREPKIREPKTRDTRQRATGAQDTRAQDTRQRATSHGRPSTQRSNEATTNEIRGIFPVHRSLSSSVLDFAVRLSRRPPAAASVVSLPRHHHHSIPLRLVDHRTSPQSHQKSKSYHRLISCRASPSCRNPAGATSSSRRRCRTSTTSRISATSSARC